MSIGIISLVLILVLALIFAFVLVLPLCFGLTCNEGFSIGNVETIQNMFPFNNPLDNVFFNNSIHKYRVVAQPVYHDLLKDIIVDGVMSSSGTGDFTLLPELSLATAPLDPHARFVAALFSPSMSIIASNDSNIIDLGDIRRYRCTVTIGVSSYAYQCLMDILSKYSKDTLSNIKIVHLDANQIIDGYGDTFKVYADMVTHPNDIFRQLTMKSPSHFVSMKLINAGSYYVTNDESPFFKKYLYYHKSLLDLMVFKKYYPMLATLNHRDLYLPTIKSPLILLAHDKVPADKVIDVMHRILAARLQPTVIDLSHMSTPLPHHPGAAKVYTDLNLHTTVEG